MRLKLQAGTGVEGWLTFSVVDTKQERKASVASGKAQRRFLKHLQETEQYGGWNKLQS